MSQIRSYLIDGYNWEATFEIDEEGKTEGQIYEELADKALEWFKASSNKSLRLSVVFGFYRKISAGERPGLSHTKRLLTASALANAKKTLFYGEVKSIQISNEQLRKTPTN